MPAKKLSPSQVKKSLTQVPLWNLTDNNLVRELKFRNFVEAFAFMAAGALEAEKLNHHPEWTNVYSSVSIKLQTHDVEGITELDFKLARKFDAVLDNFKLKVV